VLKLCPRPHPFNHTRQDLRSMSTCVQPPSTPSTVPVMPFHGRVQIAPQNHSECSCVLWPDCMSPTPHPRTDCTSSIPSAFIRPGQCPQTCHPHTAIAAPIRPAQQTSSCLIRLYLHGVTLDPFPGCHQPVVWHHHPSGSSTCAPPDVLPLALTRTLPTLLT
jgi:hypothetical protein